MNPQTLEENNLASHHFVAIKDHLYTDLKGEGVILSLKNGKYYGVNEVGACIWQAIQKPMSFQEIENAVIQEYDIHPESCRAEVYSFLMRMKEEELVEVIDGKVI